MAAPAPTPRRTKAARLAAGALLIAMYGFSHTAAAFGAAQVGTRDRDGDGMPNRWEVTHGLNPDRANARGDKDHDGLRNIGEFRRSTDPSDVDSDDDGVDDGDEVNETNTDPTDADSDDDGTPDGNEDSDDDGIDNEDEDDADEVCVTDPAPAVSAARSADDTDVDECNEDDDDADTPDGGDDDTPVSPAG